MACFGVDLNYRSVIQLQSTLQTMIQCYELTTLVELVGSRECVSRIDYSLTVYGIKLVSLKLAV